MTLKMTVLVTKIVENGEVKVEGFELEDGRGGYGMAVTGLTEEGGGGVQWFDTKEALLAWIEGL